MVLTAHNPQPIPNEKKQPMIAVKIVAVLTFLFFGGAATCGAGALLKESSPTALLAIGAASGSALFNS